MLNVCNMLSYVFVLFIFSNSLRLSYGNNVQGSLIDVDVQDYAYKFQEVLKNVAVSKSCMKEFKDTLEGLLANDEWALRMFDASGKIPSGILEGNFAEMGSFEECLDIEHESIVGQYCLSEINFLIPSESSLKRSFTKNDHISANIFNATAEKAEEGQSLKFRIAICVPNACSHSELQTLYQNIYGDIKIEEKFCQSKFSKPELDAGSIAVISFFGAVFAFMIMSTAYDAVLICLQKENKPQTILTAFSVISNGRKLFRVVEKDEKQISCMHGIRVISTMWVVIGHRYLEQNSLPMRNTVPAFATLNKRGMMFLVQAPLAVDTFFLMSGLVTSYVYSISTSKRNKFNIPLFYIHRYLRLTPILAAVMLVYLTLTKHLGNGPLWPNTAEGLTQLCKDNWWKLLLYIQNYSGGDMCIGHSWYLSADMQLFVLSPLLLIPLVRWPKVSLLLTGVLSVGTMLASFFIAWYKELNPYVLGNRGLQLLDFVKYYYFTTHTRATPWLIGIVAGYIIFQTKYKKTISLNKGTLIFLWILCLSVLPTCVFAGHGLLFGKPDRILNSLHIALVRPAWSVAVGCLICICANGFGGPIDWFLSLPIFQIVSRFTYSIYLVHYFIIQLVTSQMRAPIVFSNAYIFHVFWADFTYIFAVAAVFTLAFESPIIVLERYLLGNPRSGKTKGKASELPDKTQIIEKSSEAA